MPELPEVEVVRRGLAKNLCGRQIKSVEVFRPSTLRQQSVTEFCKRLTNWCPQAAVRRGKFLWLLGGKASAPGQVENPSSIEIDRNWALVIHLGMSGQCLINPPGLALQPRTEKHLRIRLNCQDGWTLNFIDQRTFGHCNWQPLVPTGDKQPGGLGSDLPLVPQLVEERIARDCLDPALSLEQVVERLRARRAPIKNLLLDQCIVSGIGNIYADEALFAQGINPLSAPARLPLKTIRQLYVAAGQVMQRALAQGGTSFDELYVNTQGDPGYFARSLQVYSRKGLPCQICTTSLVQIKIAGRSATYCPRCQPLSQRRPRKT